MPDPSQSPTLEINVERLAIEAESNDESGQEYESIGIKNIDLQIVPRHKRAEVFVPASPIENVAVVSETEKDG